MKTYLVTLRINGVEAVYMTEAHGNVCAAAMALALFPGAKVVEVFTID